MAVRSRKLDKNTIPRAGIKNENVAVNGAYCRHCQKTYPANEFFKATDTFLDTNGLMSICRTCIDTLYEKFIITEHTQERTILRLCRVLNVAYSPRAIEVMQRKIKTFAENGTEITKIFGSYLAALKANQTGGVLDGGESLDLTFIEPPRSEIDQIKIDGIEPIPDADYYEKFWGKGFDLEDYKFLEDELNEYKKTTKHDTYPEIKLLKELCFSANEIRHARMEGKPTANLVKNFQEIMKNSALTPATQAAISSSKSVESFGVWLKEIEQTEPAEWFADQEKFRDMDGFQEDLDDIKRSIGKFILGSRDFRLDDLEDVSGIENDLDEEPIITESSDVNSS